MILRSLLPFAMANALMEVEMSRLNRRAQSAPSTSRFIPGGAPCYGTDHPQYYFLSGAAYSAGTPTGTPRWRASRRARRGKDRIVYFIRVLPTKEGQSSLPHGQLNARST